jgi:hypothetical protein
MLLAHDGVENWYGLFTLSRLAMRFASIDERQGRFRDRPNSALL